jgi:hypothetical protein
MQNPSEIEKLIQHKIALQITNLMVKGKSRTPEESEHLAELLRNALSALPVVENDIDDSYDDAGFAPAPQPVEVPAENEEVISATTKPPTIAAAITKFANPGVVKIKRAINDAYPDEKLGGVHTPLRDVNRTFSSLFSLSPGGTTATYEQTATVVVKKNSGDRFIKPSSQENAVPNTAPSL